MRFFNCLVVVLFFLAHPVSAEEKWVSLFNGKDLAGWKVYGVEEWKVEDGAIVGETVHGKYGYLATEKNYRDFCSSPALQGGRRWQQWRLLSLDDAR